MTTNQEARQQALRDQTSTTNNTSGDWHAYWDGEAIAAGNWTGRMLAWINSVLGTSYSNVNGAMHAYAEDRGFDRFTDINELGEDVITGPGAGTGEGQGLLLALTAS